MPLVKVIRNGQITIPKGIRESLSIQDGDVLEIETSNSGFFIKPKIVIDKDEAAQKFFKQVAQMREKAEKFDPHEVDEIIAEAMEFAKKAAAKKRKAKKNV